MWPVRAPCTCHHEAACSLAAPLPSGTPGRVRKKQEARPSAERATAGSWLLPGTRVVPGGWWPLLAFWFWRSLSCATTPNFQPSTTTPGNKHPLLAPPRARSRSLALSVSSCFRSSRTGDLCAAKILRAACCLRCCALLLPLTRAQAPGHVRSKNQR